PAVARAAWAVAGPPAERREVRGFVFHSPRCERAHRQAWNWTPWLREELESPGRESQRKQATAMCAAAAGEQDWATQESFENRPVGASEAWALRAGFHRGPHFPLSRSKPAAQSPVGSSSGFRQNPGTNRKNRGD